MSDTQTLKRFIDGAAGELKRARDNLEQTPRPSDVCHAHDALFAVSKAQTNGILALLEVESSRLGSSEAQAAGGDGRVMRWFAVLLPFRWPIAVICFSPFAGDIICKVLQSLGR